MGDECGIIGELLRAKAVCRRFDEGTCAEINSTMGTSKCAWDASARVCLPPPRAVPLALQQNYTSELALLGFRRKHCMAKEDRTSCRGGCLWDASARRCSLSTIEALQELLGEACPLKRLLSGSSTCINLGNTSGIEDPCITALRSDGVAKCYRTRDGQCEPNPMAMELDVLLAIGVRDHRVANLMRSAMERCSAAHDEASCGWVQYGARQIQECANYPDLGAANRWRLSPSVFAAVALTLMTAVLQHSV